MLTRVHSRRFGPVEFNCTVASSDRGGRFDSVREDDFCYLYAADDAETAISETLLRDIPLTADGRRVIPPVYLKDRSINWIASNVDIPLVNLRSGRDLGAIGQDTWLTTCEAKDYALTRMWCTSVRAWAPWAAGMTWRSRREPDGFAYVFFEDRCRADSFEPVRHGTPLNEASRRIDRGPGNHFVKGILKSYEVSVK